MFRQAGVYNLTRTIRSILKHYRKEPPSLTMHLYSAGFRLGPKESTLHAYDGDMKHWIDCIREQKMPNELLDILDESGVRFYDGCLIVEVHDHRSTQGSNQNQSADPSSNPTSSAQPVNGQIGPVQTKSQTKPTQESASTDLPDDQVTLHRLVLSPTCETLWKDITLMNEAKIAEVLGGSHHNRGSGFQWGPITPEEAVELEAAILVSILGLSLRPED